MHNREVSIDIILTIILANISAFEADSEALSALKEYALANSLFWALAEGHACEISARRNAMEASIHLIYILALDNSC